MPADPVVAAIVIGRNEGARLVACLAALTGNKDTTFAQIVYVDSDSTDGSVTVAQIAGVRTIALDPTHPFTAARARNAGLNALRQGQAPDLVQFIDGDCVLDATWLETAKRFLASHPKVAVVCGRRREKFPQSSVYNRHCDAEWDTPIGEALACGGDALMRWEALEAVGGYDSTLIAGEEPEMCLRMRRLGWQIWRINAKMTLHDAAMTRFGQFWRRARRAGYAFAEGAAMYGNGPERYCVANVWRAAFWAFGLPGLILIGWVLFGSMALWGCLVFPAQIARLALREGGGRFAWKRATLLTVGKFAEALGVLEYISGRIQKKRTQLIEYK